MVNHLFTHLLSRDHTGQSNMGQQSAARGIESLNQSQRDCLMLVAELMSSKEIARTLNISPNTVDNRLKRAQAILGVNTRADAAKLLVAEMKAASKGPNAPCVSLVDQSLAVAKFKYARNPLHTKRQEHLALGGGDSAFEDSGAAYVPSSYTFDVLPPSWLSAFARGDVDNDLTMPAKIVMIMLLMITLSISMAVLVVVAEGLSRLF
jgi:DNA-binding CsgD family transcriptional regulator